MLVADKKNIVKYYNALVEKDQKYIGLFYAGVKTTGIFCIPTCRARKPKIENVEFYTEVNELLQNGYRPCNICCFEDGYESLSGFGYTFKRMVGSSPAGSKAKTIILITRFTTPLGPMYACATKKGICLLEFADREILEREFRDLQKRLDATILAGDNVHLDQLKKEMKEYFEGKRKEFDVRLHTPGTAFQQMVWNVLHSIPYGKTRSYQQQAEKINNPKAVRAVAAANGQNRISIVIPCHRVIGKNGKLTGYGGGLDRKKWLLDHELKHLGL